jgi:energy-converting hydrogenase Eha subunit A
VGTIVGVFDTVAAFATPACAAGCIILFISYFSLAVAFLAGVVRGVAGASIRRGTTRIENPLAGAVAVVFPLFAGIAVGW